MLNHQDEFPEYLAHGNTPLLCKEGSKSNSKNFRTITCLSTVYKILTSLVHPKIFPHYFKRGIKRNLGYKELLVIISLITKQAHIKRHNLSMSYIDYVKAFDSMPHDLLKVLEIYKVHQHSSTASQWEQFRQNSYEERNFPLRFFKSYMVYNGTQPFEYPNKTHRMLLQA